MEALNEMSRFIADKTAQHFKVSMKSLMERFTKAPYGYVEADVQWLVAKLFRKGEILYKVPLDKLVDALMAEIERL